MADVPQERIRMLLPPPASVPEPEKNRDRTLDGDHSCGKKLVLDLTCPNCHEPFDGTTIEELVAYATAALQERVTELERWRRRTSAK